MFRVTISGKLTRLTPDQRAELVKGSDVSLMAFTGAGTFTCDRTAAVFTFRCELPPSAGGDGPETDRAAVRAAALAALDGHGYPYEVLRTTIVDMREIKIPRR